MTQAPHLLASSPRGHEVRRHQADRLDGPRRPVGHLRPDRHGRADRAGQRRYDLTREEQDEFAAESHQKAARAAQERRLRRGDHPGPDPAAQGRPDRVPRGRGHPPRHHRRDAGQAQAGVRQGRHDHRRHRLADLRRRLRRRRHERGEGGGARHHPARRDRRARRRRRPGRHAAEPAVAARSRRPARARASTPRTSTSSSSTRRSPPSASSPPASSASTPRRSTPTVAPSPSATRSA